MNTIRIVADSTTDIDPALLQGKTLDVLPLVITLDDRSYLDGEEIGVIEIYDTMRKGILPKTSQVPYDRTDNLFRSLLGQGHDIIYIAFSSEMSGCFSLATMIAAELREEFPDRRIAVIDSRGGGGATGLIVLQALQLAEAGLPFETVVSDIAFMTEHIEHVFSVDDLSWLAKGGRIPKIVGYVGNKLGIRPILDVEKGRMVVRKMVRGNRSAVQAVADEIIRRAQGFPAQLIAICHADDLPSATLLEGLIRDGLPGCATALCHIGGVLGVHLGLKGIGAFCLNQMPERYCPA